MPTTNTICHEPLPGTNFRVLELAGFSVAIAGWDAAEEAGGFDLHRPNSVLSMRGKLPDWVRDGPDRVPGIAVQMVDGELPNPMLYSIGCSWLCYMVRHGGPGPVMVCCWMGQSRSVAMVTTWLSLETGMEFRESLALVEHVYPEANVHEELVRGGILFLEADADLCMLD